MIGLITSILKGMASHPVITKNLLKIKSSVYTVLSDCEVTAITSAEPIDRTDLPSYIDREVPVKKGFVWSEEKFGACWFHIKGKVDTDKKAVVLMRISGEGLSYDGEDTVDIVTPLLSITDVIQTPTVGKRVMHVVNEEGVVDCYVDCGYNGYSGNFLTPAKFHFARIAELNEDINEYYYDYATLCLLLATSDKNKRMTKKLQGELVSLLSRSYDQFHRGNLSAAKNVLKIYYDKEIDYDTVLYTMVGHGHLDLAWLWPERESKRKAVRTFTNAVSLIEKEGSYVFGASQAQMFDWVKSSHPKLFEKIKNCVKNGNIELQGGMWVESDCNMPSGESLVRQFLYGDRFFLENFGHTSDMVWLPDAFGFPATFPQIVKGVGKKYFATIKLTWNTVNKFPHQSFYWVAPDGSRILAHVSPEGTYYNDGTPLSIDKGDRRNIQKETGEGLLIYGCGDGGGGPGEGHVKIAKRSKNLYGLPRTEMGSAVSFFDRLAKASNLPEYKDELYLEKHQGTLTSQSDNKKYNRYAERELHNAEWLSALYGKEDLDYYWQRLLFTQFHDVLPGSGINRVHRESQEDLKGIVSACQKIVAEKIKKISKGTGISALNPSPFYRKEVVYIDGKTYLFDGAGYSAKCLTECVLDQKVNSDGIENGVVKVTFGSDGSILSLIDKRTGREMSKERLNKLVVYKDKPTKYNAWDIDSDYIKYPEKVELVTQSFVIEDGIAKAKQEYKYGSSVVRQTVSIKDDGIVRVDNDIDWRESHKMLRASFSPTVYSDKAEFDIQFGHIDRSTTENDSIEKAKFEVCAHKYVALSDGDIFAILSDSKYGYRVKNGEVSINLLRSPKYPDESCDMGRHTFSYGIALPLDRKELVAMGYNFNHPLVVTGEDISIDPFVTVDCDNVIVETVKPAEEGGVAVRLYERYGIPVTTRLKINGTYEKLISTNLLEKEGEITGETLTFSPHEIKTIVITHAKCDHHERDGCDNHD